jgi:hypothetical protein
MNLNCSMDLVKDARNALAEAREIAGPDAWVLEPSPPAVTQAPFFADDPARAGTLDWGAWVERHPERTSWVADRWLSAWPRLGPAPANFAETRAALHRLAFYVMTPARVRANGRIGLRFTIGGFGTPFFGADEQVRVAGTDLIVQRGDSVSAQPITSLADLAQLVLGGPPDTAWADRIGVRDRPPLGDVHAAVPLDADAVRSLGDWYGFAWSVLEEFRSDAETAESLRVQLWPEHFDAAIDCFEEDRQITFGASPGDQQCGEPYLYVAGPSVAAVPSDLWNATFFKGAILSLGELLVVDDQRAAALEFFRARLAVLNV